MLFAPHHATALKPLSASPIAFEVLSQESLRQNGGRSGGLLLIIV
jgi:hypothetical protein